MDTEFWTSVINGSANLFIAASMIIQTIILIISFRIGLNYLSKYKSQKRLEMILDIKGLMSQYRKSMMDVYSIPFNIQKKIESDPLLNKQLLIDFLENVHYDNVLSVEAMNFHVHKINQNFDLINEVRLKTKWERIYSGNHILIQSFASLHTAMVESNDLSWFELYKVIPKNLNSGLSGHINLARRLFLELQQDLTDLYQKS